MLEWSDRRAGISPSIMQTNDRAWIGAKPQTPGNLVRRHAPASNLGPSHPRGPAADGALGFDGGRPSSPHPKVDGNIAAEIPNWARGLQSV